jgi:FlaA1/EpsC-like NDP-sugar epimerase
MWIRKLITRALISRFLILSVDLGIVLISFLIANLLRFNFLLPEPVQANLFTSAVYVLAIRLIPFLALKSYAGVIKYTGEEDAIKVLRATSISTVLFICLNYLIPNESKDLFLFYPVSIILIDYLLTNFLLIAYRVTLKFTWEEIRKSKQGIGIPAKNVAIFGAGKSGIILKKALSEDKSSGYNVVAWLDDNYLFKGKSLEGLRIFNAEKDFESVVKNLNINTIILSMQNIEPARKQAFVDICFEHNIQMLYTPPVQKWLNGEFNVHQLKRFNIEDVLDREPIVLDNKYLEFQLAEKTILVTGAAGSIGSEIVRQVSAFQPDKLILVDVAESPIVDLFLEMQERYRLKKIIPIVADVSNQSRMERIFSEYKPDIVYHAAAYKHVPIMEDMPYEAIRVNVLGTKTVADLAVKYLTERFVMISTDKAVNPTNVMGCSKRIAEIYIQSLNNQVKNVGGPSRFITTRFGNVLGSNGSVIPRFQKQLEAGGPITVTDERITRFFMTIPEACQLVLDAGAMGKGGEIFIFDMGKPVKIKDLAEKMIKLSGMIPYKDIQIVYSGLRPGEKLEEELLAKKENIIPTHHHKIMKAKVREYNFEEIEMDVRQLLDLLQGQVDVEIVAKMKAIVPEYLSNNSIFEHLDNEKVS